MARFLTLLVLAALTVAEVAAVLGLVGWLGPGGALLVLAADVLIGLMIMQWAVRSPQGQRGFRFAAGSFIALPGFVLDAVGIALLVPPVQRWVRRSLLSTTETVLSRSGVNVVRITTTDVIPGSVVDADGEADAGTGSGPATTWPGPGMPTDRAGGQPDPGPRVIRGEIESE